MREISLEQRLIDAAKRFGGVALKGENVAGFPDRIILLPGGRVYFIEVKRPGGKMSDRQREWMYDLMALGMQHREMWNQVDLNDFIREVEVWNCTAIKNT